MIDLRGVECAELRAGASGVKVVDPGFDVTRRALLAYLKSTKNTEGLPKTTTVEHLGKQYVALVTYGGVAAIYRVRNDLQLKRMRRIPQAVAYAVELHRRDLSDA